MSNNMKSKFAFKFSCCNRTRDTWIERVIVEVVAQSECDATSKVRNLITRDEYELIEVTEL